MAELSLSLPFFPDLFRSGLAWPPFPDGCAEGPLCPFLTPTPPGVGTGVAPQQLRASGKRLALLWAQQLGPFEFPLSCFRALGGSRRLGI